MEEKRGILYKVLSERADLLGLMLGNTVGKTKRQRGSLEESKKRGL